MKEYDVTITETLQKTVRIRAESLVEAEQIAEEKWNNSEYILDAEHFKGADFHGVERVREQSLER